MVGARSLPRFAVVAAAVAVLLVAGSCSSAEETAGNGSGDDSTQTSGTASEAGGGGDGDGSSGGGPPDGDGGGSGPSPDDGGSGDPGGDPGGGGAPDDDGGGDEESPSGEGHGLVVDDRAEVGAMGPALLRDDIAEAVIEIDSTADEAMTDQARAALADRLSEHGNKGSVGFAEGSTVPGQDVYSTERLRAMTESHRAVWSDESRVSVYVMVLSGRHENDDVVGIAFDAGAFAIFPDQLHGGLLGLNYSNFEEAVVVHELGHLFGLVNLTGHGAFHEDPEHPGHSSNDESVMHWAVESTVVEDVFEGGPPREFDEDDRTEMRNIREAA